MTTSNDGIDRDRLRAVTEKIQLGDAEEGLEGLVEVIEVARDQERTSARHAVRQELVDLQIQAENQAALKKFEKKYPKLRDEPVLAEAAVHVLRDEITRDLKAAGVTDEELAPIREDAGRLGAAHAAARMRGLNVRSADKVLDDVGGELSRKFNLKPEGTGRSPDQYVRDLRAERGFRSQEAALHDGGRSSSRAPGSGSITADQAQKTATYVEKLRQARGFAPRTPR